MARDVLALGKWPFPPLDGVIEAPALRLDGTILHAQGYDAPSLLYLQPDPQLHVPAVPMQPTTQEMSRGKQLIDELLVDFPFDGEASKANAIALLLTPIVRPAIHGQVPLALIDKPAPGTGAGLLVELVAEIATGRSASLTSAPRDEQEWRRTVTALLLHWGMLVIFDNLDETLASGTLAGAITARSWIDRQVSKGTVVEVPQRVTWVATGNNIHLGGDLARRCSLVRMDAKVDRPWDRGGFVHPDLVAWVRSQRSDLLWALLTLARGWCAAGRPACAAPTLGGFEEWRATVGGIVQFGGWSGFLGNLDALHSQTATDAAEWEEFLDRLDKQFGSEEFKAAALLPDLQVGGSLRDALPEALSDALERSRNPATVLGREFRRRRGVRYGNDHLRLEAAPPDGHSKINRWRVMRG